ncbi:MAG: hypothetical protein ACI87H_001300 [Gammaproteobacteria bacterium]|jgi:hypothetical protein
MLWHETTIEKYLDAAAGGKHQNPGILTNVKPVYAKLGIEQRALLDT